MTLRWGWAEEKTSLDETLVNTTPHQKSRMESDDMTPSTSTVAMALALHWKTITPLALGCTFLAGQIETNVTFYITQLKSCGRAMLVRSCCSARPGYHDSIRGSS